ncbi:unnamed protein product [Spirodela intermedia]|uniref:Uncharacterized protein n=2 Tax=Spirodela intermedia TaxID=51605 RepID=A0A7I8ILV8_SPIIN|nr:unnamed protein product [Spirodela intermedia]CAA6658926.1 unnamed protein product [Spirodela intermedia]CAA7395211.1 unnamed protein product [Spirodela intermedia]
MLMPQTPRESPLFRSISMKPSIPHRVPHEFFRIQ